MKTYNRLSARLRAFVRAHVETGVGTKAMKAIGFTGTRPDVAASKLLSKPGIRQAIREYEAHAVEQSQARIYAVVIGLERTANVDPRLIVDENGDRLPLERLPDEIAAAIQGIDVEERWEGRGEDRERVTTFKYRFANRNEARKLLMQYQRVLVQQHEHSGPNGGPIPVGRGADDMSDDELAAIAGAGRPAPAQPASSTG